MSLNEQALVLGQQRLVESAAPLRQRWSNVKHPSTGRHMNFLEGIKGTWNQTVMACILENQHKHLYGELTETTRATMLGDFEKFAFPVLRGVFSSLYAQELVSVQPLQGPVSQVFTMQFHYGSTKGRIKRGDPMFSFARGHDANYNYTSELVEEEESGVGTGAVANFTGTLDYAPPRPRTIIFTTEDGAGNPLRVVDDGNGNLTGDVNGAGTNAIDYTTGNFDVTFSANVGTGAPVLVSYEYDSEGHQGIPEVDLIFQSSTVHSRPRKLRARWSVESAQDLRALYGVDGELELVAAMVEEIKAEINREIVVDIEKKATGGRTMWSKTPAMGVSYQTHKESFVDSLIALENQIFSRTRRFTTNWLVADVQTCNVVQTLDGFVAQPVSSDTAGMIKIGTLQGKWAVYKDPYMRPNTALGDNAADLGKFVLGYKGDSFFKAGYVYCPYVGIYATPTVQLDDHVSRKGLGTRYGKKMLLTDIYAVGTVRA